MKKFRPYANEADVLQLGGLQIENRLDRITLSGDLDLTADRAGLAQARELKRLLDSIVERLESQDLPDRLPPASPTTVDNPFS